MQHRQRRDDIPFCRSDRVDVHRRPGGRIDSRRLFSVPLTSAFRSYDGCRGEPCHRLANCDNQTENRDDDDNDNDDGRNHGCSDDVNTADDGGQHTGDGTSSGDQGCLVNQLTPPPPPTPRKQIYSVVELLRNDRPSGSSDHADAGSNDAASTLSLQTSGSFHVDGGSWKVEKVDQLQAPPPLFATRWPEWTTSDDWMRSKFDSATRRRCPIALFGTPPSSVNFVSNYARRQQQIRRDTELQLQQCSLGLPLRSREYLECIIIVYPTNICNWLIRTHNAIKSVKR